MQPTIGKNLRRLLVTALAGAGLHVAPASAIDLLHSYELALVNDGQLKVARAKADSGREALPQAFAQLLPNVAFSLAYGQTEQDRTLNNITEPTARYPSETYNLTLRQPLYRQYQFSQYEQAKSKVAGTEAQLDKDLQGLGARLVTTYFQALFARDSLGLIGAQKMSYQAQLRAAKLALAAGSGTRTDIDDIQTKYDLLLAQEIEARQAIGSSTLQLQIYVGEPIEQLSTLDPARFHADAHDPATLQEWVDRAVEYSPDLRYLKATWDAAVSGIQMARAGHLPTLDLVAQHNYSKGDANNVFPKTENTTNYIGVQLSVPIFAGGGVNSAVRASTAAAEEARQAFEYARDDLRLKVRNQYDAVKAGISRVRALEDALVSADRNVMSNQKGVLAGTRTTLDVLNVQQQRFNTQVDLARARYQILVAWATLLSYVGDLNVEQVTRLNRVLDSAV
jgi:outer membrane protein/protease secretion system outer membrane protein